MSLSLSSRVLETTKGGRWWWYFVCVCFSTLIGEVCMKSCFTILLSIFPRAESSSGVACEVVRSPKAARTKANISASSRKFCIDIASFPMHPRPCSCVYPSISPSTVFRHSEFGNNVPPMRGTIIPVISRRGHRDRPSLPTKGVHSH